MEILQRNLYVASFISNKLKCHVFPFYLFSFFFYKIGEQEDGTSPAQGLDWHQWEGGGDGERE
jgi:hypothetical protein